MSLSIEALTVAEVEAERATLVALLRDAVESGASVGFLPVPVKNSIYLSRLNLPRRVRR